MAAPVLAGGTNRAAAGHNDRGDGGAGAARSGRDSLATARHISGRARLRRVGRTLVAGGEHYRGPVVVRRTWNICGGGRHVLSDGDRRSEPSREPATPCERQRMPRFRSGRIESCAARLVGTASRCFGRKSTDTKINLNGEDILDQGLWDGFNATCWAIHDSRSLLRKHHSSR
jgi:hypothetical protein